MSIGLQTSLAIALHKLPEGFITYATNHANPQLGFAVFLALFIHNITEGFAMALPLYLAINSRWKAMVISSILGGASQPLGAGVAALWFRIAGRTGIGEPGESVYGGMFAVTGKSDLFVMSNFTFLADFSCSWCHDFRGTATVPGEHGLDPQPQPLYDICIRRYGHLGRQFGFDSIGLDMCLLNWRIHGMAI